MADISLEVTKITELAHKHWHTKYALLLAEILAFLISTAILLMFKPNNWLKLLVYLFCCIITYVFWWWTNRLPKTKKNKVGFVISISAGDENERKRVMEDFVYTLHKLVKEGTSGNSFQIIKIPEHVAEKIIDLENARELRSKCRAHFVIYGRVRPRIIDGKQEHLIELNGLVTHTPLPAAIHQGFSKEFTELLPSRLRVPFDNDAISFEFASHWINYVSRYIIGVAAAFSGDLDYAEKLYGDVNQFLNEHDQSFPVFISLKQRIPLRLAEINFARARIAFNLIIPCSLLQGKARFF